MKEYAVADVRVEEHNAPEGRFWSKSVLVWREFSVGASVYRENSLDGFGLWLKRAGAGFSWEWFDLVSSGAF